MFVVIRRVPEVHVKEGKFTSAAFNEPKDGSGMSCTLSINNSVILQDYFDKWKPAALVTFEVKTLVDLGYTLKLAPTDDDMYHVTVHGITGRSAQRHLSSICKKVFPDS